MRARKCLKNLNDALTNFAKAYRHNALNLRQPMTQIGVASTNLQKLRQTEEFIWLVPIRDAHQQLFVYCYDLATLVSLRQRTDAGT